MYVQNKVENDKIAKKSDPEPTMRSATMQRCITTLLPKHSRTEI